MKIRLIICTILIAFLSKVAFVEIVTFSVTDKPESTMSYRLPGKFAVKQTTKKIKTSPEFLFKQHVNYTFITAAAS